MNTYNAIEPGEQLWWFGVGVLLAFILFFCAFAPRIAHPRRKQWERGLGWAILLNQVWVTAMLMLDGDYLIAKHLPLHMCSFTQILLFLHLVMDKQWAFTVSALWGPLGGIQAILTPVLTSSLTWPYVTQFFTAHAFVVVVPIYLMVHAGRRLPKRAFRMVMGITTVVAVTLMGINEVLGSNYMYVTSPPPVNHPLVQGDWPEYLLVLFAAGTALFYLFLIVFRKYVGPEEAANP